MCRGTIAAIVVPLVAGCAGDGSTTCALPELEPYDAATLARAADELAAAPDDCVICDWIVDYGRLRAQIRALRDTE
jgi:hypothetical protein